MSENHYAALGLPITAPSQDIRSAFHQLALKHHPDKIRDPAARDEGAAKFRSVQEAYEILSDPVQRKAYDRRWADELRGYQNRCMEAEEQSKLDRSWCYVDRAGGKRAKVEK